MRRALIITGILAAAAVALLLAADRSLPAFEPGPGEPMRGAYHVHTDRSPDSDLPQGEIEQAARELGLDFIFLTDHNKQAPEAVTRDGLTIFSFAELTTPTGHLVQLGASPLLKAIERKQIGVHRLIRRRGGLPLVSHPNDRRRPWEGPLDEAGGLEIANIASSARRRAGGGVMGFLPAMAASVFSSETALIQLYDRDGGALERWDQMPDPRFIGLCAADLHGRLDLSQNLTAWEIVLERELPRNAPDRDRRILDEVIGGRFYCRASLVGRPGFSFFGLLREGGRLGMGRSAAAESVSELIVEGPRVASGPQAEIVLFRDGEVISQGEGEKLRYPDPVEGTYRVEVRVDLPEVVIGHRRVPVIYSNRIRLHG